MNYSPDFTKKACAPLFVLLVGLLLATADPHPQNLQGDWTISKEAGFTPVAYSTETPTRQLRGSELKITHRNIQFQDRSCNYRVLERGSQTPEEFIEFYRLEKAVSLPVDVEVLQLECDDELHLAHLLSSPGSLWFMWAGVLLEAGKN